MTAPPASARRERFRLLRAAASGHTTHPPFVDATASLLPGPSARNRHETNQHGRNRMMIRATMSNVWRAMFRGIRARTRIRTGACTSVGIAGLNGGTRRLRVGVSKRPCVLLQTVAPSRSVSEAIREGRERIRGHRMSPALPRATPGALPLTRLRPLHRRKIERHRTC